MIPWPSAYAWINEKRLNVFAAEETAEFGTNGAAPGTVLAADCKNGLLVAVGDGTARLKELRLEGRNCMTDTEFLRGYNIPVGTILNGKNKND
jgi:methionyl-tRNA formyltransferase